METGAEAQRGLHVAKARLPGRRDFQADEAPRLVFLKQLGVEDSVIISFFHISVAYFGSKKFSAESVASMVSRAPYLLNFSVKRMDNRLGFYQQQLGLSAQKTRDFVVCLPRLLCGMQTSVKDLFLQYLDKAQYDPAKPNYDRAKPNYISLDKLVSLPDEAFCNEIAAVKLKDFELFQKTV
uniref:Uncharacterized protein n=1 Tax=Oncorhynchus tshawytscha TaxID=74940 RepID=A0A8C8CFY3_ONCTS